jgi:NAD+ synthase
VALEDRIAGWIRNEINNAGLDGAVVGLSGGIDSAVVSGLCAQALGKEKVLGLIMPCHSSAQDAHDAALAASAWGIDARTVDLGPVYDTLTKTLPTGSDLAMANLKPRLRMLTLYHHANTLQRAVVGTGNKSELLAGYFTKFGDGGVDLLPIAGLYKHQVRDLARQIGVPPAIIDRPPSAGLWEGQTDEGEMGITYAELDATLEAIQAGELSEVAPATLQRVERMMTSSAHKRRMPPIFQPT